jgi:hypothetical protein
MISDLDEEKCLKLNSMDSKFFAVIAVLYKTMSVWWSVSQSVGWSVCNEFQELAY